jgi:hypothetical protein
MNPPNPPVAHPLTGILKNLNDEEFSKIIDDFPAEVSVPLYTRFKDKLPKDKFVPITRNGPALPVSETSDDNKEKIVVWYTPDQCKVKFPIIYSQNIETQARMALKAMFWKWLWL